MSSALAVMNPRRVHAKMVANFPEVDLSELPWVHVMNGEAIDRHRVAIEIERHFSGEDVFVEVSRGLGDLMPAEAVPDFIAAHVGSDIKIANAEFTKFAMLATNGVLATWVSSERRSSHER